MTSSVNQAEINAIVWKACDTFRGAVDPSEYKNYILTMLFLKYLSDLWKDRKAEYEAKYKGDAERVRRALSRERFVLPAESSFIPSPTVGTSKLRGEMPAAASSPTIAASLSETQLMSLPLARSYQSLPMMPCLAG